jgi:DNA mismatch repair protein MutS2
MPHKDREIRERYSLDVLEYDVIIHRLAGCTQSPLGHELAEELLPSSNAGEIRTRLDFTDDARRFFDRESALVTFQGLNDVRDPVGKAGKGGLLGVIELWKVNSTLKSVRSARRVIREAQFEYPNITREGQKLGVFPEIEDALDHAIHPDGDVLDRASPELQRIRTELQRERERAERTLASMINNYSRHGYLRDSNYTIRNGRYVLPFRQDCQKNVKSVVQARSPTGATVFLEPLELVERNNRLSELKGEEEDEVARILAELSALVGTRADEIRATLNTAAFLDFVFACGRLSRDLKGSRAEMGDGVDLRAARHPMIPPTEVVPVDIAFPGKSRAMILSGPNAGGKTVALKTMGLFALLNQAGLHIPARDGSTLQVFGSIHADIGDQQSIEWNLSSFSAHVVFLKRAIASLGRDDHLPALVLLDEIGRSTDPQEGSALSLAVIERLLETDTYTAVTTHLPAIKNLALGSDERVVGASVEFDIENAQPLYTIRVGTLGASYAIAIARRLGLDAEILKRADELILEKSDLLAIDLPSLEHRLEVTKAEIRDAEEGRDRADKELSALIVMERLITLSAIQKAESVVHEAEKRLEDARKLAAQMPHKLDQEQATDELKSIREFGEKLRKAADALAAPIFEPASQMSAGSKGQAVGEVRKGDVVWVLSLRRQGEVLELGPKRSTVAVSGKRLKVPTDQIKPLEPREIEEMKISKAKTPPQKSLPLFIDLHGLTVDEAVVKLDPYLDEAYYQGRERVHVIHGVGTGRLRKGIHEHLKKHQLVESMELAEVEQGGAGVTIVSLKGKGDRG